MFWIGVGDCNENPEPNPPVGKDLTGDGVHDLVISEFTGGFHSSTLAHIFQIGSKLKKLATLDGVDSAIYFRDLDGDGRCEVILRDWIFRYWNMSFAASPGIKVILRYKNGRYSFAPDLMRQPPMSVKQLADRASKIRRVWDSAEEKDSDLLSELWSTMLNLIYSGNADQAYQLFFMAYPDNSDMNDKLAEFKGQLATSHFWPDVKAMNAGKI